MLMEATGGQSAAPEGFTIYLSTQSDEPPAGVFKEKVDEFRRIRDGEIQDPEKLPVLYEYPEAMLEAPAYLDPANFYVTNPNVDQSVRHSWLVKKLEEKRRGDKGAFNICLSKHERRDRNAAARRSLAWRRSLGRRRRNWTHLGRCPAPK